MSKVLSERMKKLREKLKDSTILITTPEHDSYNNLYKILGEIDYYKLAYNKTGYGYFIQIDSDIPNRATDFWGDKKTQIIFETNGINFRKNFFTFDGESFELCEPSSVDIEQYLINYGKTNDIFAKRLLYKVLRQDVPPEDKKIDETSFKYKIDGNKINIIFKSQEL